MYGTVARLRVKPGKESKLHEQMKEFEELNVEGYVNTIVYKMDATQTSTTWRSSLKTRTRTWRTLIARSRTLDIVSSLNYWRASLSGMTVRSSTCRTEVKEGVKWSR